MPIIPIIRSNAKSSSYIKTVTFFSGNATVVDLGDGAYGFNLGQIEGLDSSVKTVTITIANATVSNTYTLTYDNTGIGDMWTDLDTLSGVYVQIADVTNYDCYLFNEHLASSEVGKVYNITISGEKVDPNFKAAVEEVIAESGDVYETPSNVEVAIMESLPILFAAAIQSGKSNTDVTLPNDDETALLIREIATDIVSGKNVTVKIPSIECALKPILGLANSYRFEYDVQFYYTYNNYIFRVTLKIYFTISTLSSHADVFAELMASPNT